MNKEDERILRIYRKVMEYQAQALADMVSDPQKIIEIDLAFPFYEQGRFHPKGEVVRDRKTGGLFRCNIPYDGSLQPDWNLQSPSLWFPYHGRDIEHAYLFVHPTCADDIYKTGEMMTWTDGLIYEALSDTSYSPEEYPAHWRCINGN